MHGIFFYIGLGAGLGAACGLRPFLPLLLAGALASAGALGVHFAPARSTSWKKSWWLLVVAVTLVLAYVAQLAAGAGAGARSASSRQAPDPLAAAIAGLALGAGALLFAGTLAAHGDAWWPGLLGGLAAARAGPAGRRPGHPRGPLASRRRRRPPGAERLPRRRLAGARRARRAAASARLRAGGAARLVAAAQPLAGRRRSTPVCASCAADGPRRGRPALEAGPVRDRRDGAGDARAGGRGGHRADARADPPARPLRARLRGGVPLGHAGVRRLDRHRHRARTST